MNKLGIFGDSFADLNPYDKFDKQNNILPWPIWLSEMMNKELLCHSKSSSAIWYAYEKFVQNFDSCDTIVFCYSNHLRFNGLPEELAGFSNLTQGWENWVPRDDHEIAKVIYEGRRYMQNDNLQLFVYQKVFEDVNNMCRKANKKLVNVLPFEGMNSISFKRTETRNRLPYFIDFSKAQYPSLVSLFDVSAEETFQPNYPYGDISKPDIRHCHLSPYNNIVLARLILETFDKPKDFVYDCFTHKEFSYDAYR